MNNLSDTTKLIDQIQKEYLFREVTIIQDIIKRMNTNSFQIKGWAITLIVGILLLKFEEYQTYITFIPLLVFWGLDAYYLHQERLYRKLYKWVIENRLKSDEFQFDMSTDRFRKDCGSVFRVMFSKTIFSIYFSVLMIILLYIIITPYLAGN